MVLLSAVRTFEIALELLAGAEHEANAAGDPAGEEADLDMGGARRQSEGDNRRGSAGNGNKTRGNF